MFVDLRYECNIEYNLGSVRRTDGSDRVCHFECADDGYDSRDTFRASDYETGDGGPLAVWHGDQQRRLAIGMPCGYHERDMVVSWRTGDSRDPSGVGVAVLYHDNRDTLRASALQADEARAVSLRQGSELKARANHSGT